MSKETSTAVFLIFRIWAQKCKNAEAFFLCFCKFKVEYLNPWQGLIFMLQDIFFLGSQFSALLCRIATLFYGLESSGPLRIAFVSLLFTLCFELFSHPPTLNLQLITIRVWVEAQLRIWFSLLLLLSIYLILQIEWHLNIFWSAYTLTYFIFFNFVFSFFGIALWFFGLIL